MSAVSITSGPAATRATKQRLCALPIAHFRVHSPTSLIVFVTASFAPSPFVFALLLALTTLFRVQAVVQLNIEAVSHTSFVLISYFTS